MSFPKLKGDWGLYIMPVFLPFQFRCLYSPGKHTNCTFFTNNVTPSPKPVRLMESLINFNGPVPYSTKKQLWSSLTLTSVDINQRATAEDLNLEENGLWTGLCLCLSTTYTSSMMLAVPCACCLQKRKGKLHCNHDKEGICQYRPNGYRSSTYIHISYCYSFRARCI